MDVSVTTPSPFAREPIGPIATLVQWFRTWFKMCGVFFSDALVYKANAVIWLMTDTVPAIVMPLIWLSSFNGRATIQGFNPSQMVIYYMVVLLLASLVESHVMWEMAGDVKQGKFNIYLTRPFSYMAYIGADNLSWRFMRTLISVPIFMLILAGFHKWVHWNASEYHYGWQFCLAVLLGHILSFCLSYTLGLLSLWLVETQSLFHFYYLPLVIFNGQIAPLSFFPASVRAVAKFLPFNYTLGFPAQIFTGTIAPSDIALGFAVQCGWISVALFSSVFLWRGGLKRYTAYGI
ncbi:MAG TPA: ABC-2 family transporter protein [Capsulimonadaceae bacterium]